MNYAVSLAAAFDHNRSEALRFAQAAEMDFRLSIVMVLSQ
jgi:hypothetical protein